ncbi:MAG: LysR family transcriptional regulator [Clostridiales Family XIII bacterium]|jgi:DNA-binding transcriptional LysR family regulator|nr:LysR family transcriptional regulator [Clostridiales Family XIII bacterium]
MDTTQLKYFVSLAQSLNFTNVAKQYFVTQPAISHQISKLEEGLGVRLFHRNKHHVSLTSEGEAFYRYAADMLTLSASAEERLRQISEGKEASLRVSAVSSTTRALKKCITEFTKRCPDVNLEIECMTGQQQVLSINKLDCDFYFSTATILQNMRKLTMMEIDNDRYSIFAQADIAKQIDVDDFSTLAKFDLCAEIRTNGLFLMDKILTICKDHRYKPGKVRYFSSFMSTQIAVSAGMGYSIMPSWMGDWFSSPIVSKPIGGDSAVVKDAVAWDDNTMELPKIMFLEVLREVFPER